MGRRGVRVIRAALVLLPALLLVAPLAAAAGVHYAPRSGDTFAYSERIQLTDGMGNYTGYSEDSSYAGSITVTSVQTNGTDAAAYQASGTFRDNQGHANPWSESGAFTFSATTFHYVQGTDNQSGYSNPYVWFYMDNTLGNGSTFYALNTQMTVVSTTYPFAQAASSTGYVRTIFAEGNSSYQRHDSYGIFTATVQWKAYFDPATGYVVGYVSTETDRDGAGDGFTVTDTLTDTHTSFALTPASAPPAPAAEFPWETFALILGVALVLVVAIVVGLLLVRSRRGRLPQHPTAAVPGALPTYAPPPPIDLIPRDQPPVQQVVLRETVKVPCRYCGTLIDSTATVCPKCGAPRT